MLPIIFDAPHPLQANSIAFVSSSALYRLRLYSASSAVKVYSTLRPQSHRHIGHVTGA